MAPSVTAPAITVSMSVIWSTRPLKDLLGDRDIEPPVVLAPHFTERAHHLVAEVGDEGYAGFVLAPDETDQGVAATLSGRLHDLLSQRPPDPVSQVGRGDVDRRLERLFVGAARVVVGQAAPAGYLAAHLGDLNRQPLLLVLGVPSGALGCALGGNIEGNAGVEDVVIVNIQYGAEVGFASFPHGHLSRLCLAHPLYHATPCA